VDVGAHEQIFADSFHLETGEGDASLEFAEETQSAA
jgi:hypothetical protein